MKNKLDFVLLYTQLKYGVRLYSFLLQNICLWYDVRNRLEQWWACNECMVQIQVVIFENGRHQYS